MHLYTPAQAVDLQQHVNPLGGAIGNSEGETNALPQVDAIGRSMLHPRKMPSVVWEMNSAQGSLQLSLQLSSKCHKTQSLHT